MIGSATRPLRATGRRGFTLIELLITVAILAMIALVGMTEVVKAFKKQRLVATVQNVETFARRAYQLMQERNSVQFLYLAPYNATLKGTPLLIVEDRAPFNGFPDKTTEVDVTIAGTADPDGVVRQRMYLIGTGADGDISLSFSDEDEVQSVNWSYFDGSNPPAATGPTSNALPRWIRCDFVGRTANDNCGMASDAGTPACRLGMQIPAPASLFFTHREMVPVPAILRPAQQYTISISPAWSVYTVRATLPDA